jgi:hypothetical protein
VSEARASVHWLTVTVHVGADDVATVEDVRRWAQGRLGGPVGVWEPLGHGGRRFGRVDRLCGRGAVLYSEPQSSSMGEIVSVDFSGDACEEMGAAGAVQLLEEANAAGWWWGVSRLDLACDDVGFSPLDVWEAIERGDVRTWCHISEPDAARLMVGGCRVKRTHTVYIGKPQSERMLRIYDRRGGTRVELQLRGDHARAVGKALPVVGELPATVVGAIRSFFDCIDRSGHVNVSECSLLPWWAAWVDGVVKFHAAVVRPEPNLDSATRWVEQALAPTLAAVMRARGRTAQPWLRRLLLEDGPARWSGRHRAIVSEGSAREDVGNDGRHDRVA